MKYLKTIFLPSLLLILFPTVWVLAAPGNTAPYIGGTGQGWSEITVTNQFIGWGLWTISGQQDFVINQASTAVLPFQINFDGSAMPTSSSGMQIIIPADTTATWDPSITTVSLSGTAASDFNTTVSYSSNDKLMYMTLNTSVTAGQNLIISGVNLTNFTQNNQESFRLSADTNNDGIAEVTDDMVKVIHPASGWVTNQYTGGTGQGWSMIKGEFLWLGPQVKIGGGVHLEGGVHLAP